MDNGDQIQQTNLVNDDAAAAMGVANSGVQTATNEAPATVQPQTDPIPAGSAADPIAPPISAPGTSGNDVSTSDATTPDAETSNLNPVTSETPTDDAGVDDSLSSLDDIKKSALEELKPLIEHVEQEPEERFETVMMMIRSNDDPKLIPTAYEAAKGIKDDKKRASALLNIVSEIEYLKAKSQ